MTARSSVGWICAAALALSGCGPTRLTVKPDIPPLLLTPLPLSMGVRIPKTFAEYVDKQTGQERQWEIKLGPGQSEAIRRVTAAMFEHTLVLGDPASGDAATIAAHKLNAILETTLDSYVYLLPSSGGADYYSATIGYKVALLSVDGTVLGSWIYEGYGSAPSRRLGSVKGVELVTALAIRDACANLAVHLPDQERVRNLMAPAATAPAVPSPSIPSAAPSSGPTTTGAAATASAPPSATAPPQGTMPPAGAALSSTPAATPSAEPPKTGTSAPQVPAAPAASPPGSGPPSPVAPPAAPTAPAEGAKPATADGPPTTGN